MREGARRTDAEPASTSQILLEEFEKIHDQKPPDYNEAAKAEALKKAKDEYEEGNGAGSWDVLSDDKKEERARLRFYFNLVHELKSGSTLLHQAALCLSGGGIRSAAFALGVLQGLARHKLLSQFSYLSTVSGGGYIGAWLTAWAHRAAANKPSRSFTDIEKQLGGLGLAPEPLGELRKNKAFLTPRVGIGSPDTWAAIAHVVRNLLLNWLVFIPLLAALLLIPRAVQGLLLYWTYSTEHPRSILVELWNSGWHGSGAFHITIDPHTWLDGLGLALVAGGVALSMASRSASSKEAVGDRGFRRYVLLPVIAGGFLLLMQACSWLSHGERPTLTMLSQWVVLGGIAFVCIRVLAWAVWAMGPWPGRRNGANAVAGSRRGTGRSGGRGRRCRIADLVRALLVARRERIA